MLASEGGHAAVVEVLLKYDAGVDVVNEVSEPSLVCLLRSE